MSLKNLENLVKTGELKIEIFNEAEFNGLINSGKARIKDASKLSLAPESRFDLAYNAAHSFALAALRKHGYRSNNRYIVFQVLPHTLSVGPEVWRVLAKCHDCRNVAEYEGYFEVDDQLLKELLSAVQLLLNKISQL